MKKPYIMAIAMSVFIVLWMASGLLRDPEGKELHTPATAKDQRMLVQTETKTAQDVQLTLTVQGHVEPKREVKIRTDLPGRIEKILVEEGEWVESGTPLVRLGIEDRRIKLDREKALLQSRQKSYTRMKTLAKGNFQSQSTLEDAYVALKAAEASVAEMEFEIKKLEIKAPFAGTLDIRWVEQGGYVLANSEIARFVDNSLLIVAVQVAQQDIQKLTLGAMAEVSFATGEVRQGKIRYISSLASETTRTFRVEIAIDNPERIIPAGISAEAKIPTQKITGHFFSPAILGLNASGQMGVKTVDETDTVIFYPITIIQATTEGVWVRGLPSTARIITVGQGFVEEGTRVDVQSSNEITPDPKKDVDDQSNVAQKVLP